MSVAEEAIRKATGWFNAPLECWGCTNSAIYHADMFHTYRNCPNKMEPEVRECKAVNSILRPTKFSNGRLQGFPGHPI